MACLCASYELAWADPVDRKYYLLRMHLSGKLSPSYDHSPVCKEDNHLANSEPSSRVRYRCVGGSTAP